MVDEDVHIWCNWAEGLSPEVLQTRLRGRSTLRKVDLSANQIGDHGLHRFLSTLVKLKLKVEGLWLQNNVIGRAGCAALADFILTTQALQELHLSHNYVDSVGAMYIVEAQCKVAPHGVERDSGKLVPLWFRLEQNRLLPSFVQEANVVALKHKRATGRGICDVSMQGHCSSYQCKFADRPAIHIVYCSPHIDGRSRQRPLRDLVPPEATRFNLFVNAQEELARWKMERTAPKFDQNALLLEAPPSPRVPTCWPPPPPQERTLPDVDGSPPKESVPASPGKMHSSCVASQGSQAQWPMNH